MATKLRGVVKTVKREEGFGFITHIETGIDHFFHRSNLANRGDWGSIEIGLPVVFVELMGPKGARATEVEIDGV